MAALTPSGGRMLALLAFATGAFMVTIYVRRYLRNKRRRRPEGDDDSGVDLDVGSELSLRDEDATARDTDDDNSDAALRENQVSLTESQTGNCVGVSPSEADATLAHLSEESASMTSAEAEVLSSLLTTSDVDLLQRTLITVGNAAAFTRNQNLLREAGCLKKLIRLLRTHEMALRVGQSVTYPAVVTRVVNTVTNLAVNEENQKQLQDCIPALIDFAKCASAPESVQVSSLQALTNLSVTSSYHPPYTKLIQHLYECLDNGSKNIQLHALKVLVNLSSNPEMVPHLLAAKAPSSLLSTIVPRSDEDLLLRWVTFLANVMWTSRDKSLTSTSLPTEYKAASPETMWTALYGHNNSVHLRSKVFVLSKHKHESVRYHAARIYSCLT